MATLAEHPLASAPNSLSPMPVINRGFEPEMEAFVNLDQFTYTSSEPARAKLAALPTQAPLPNTDFMVGHVRSAGFASSGQSPLAFHGPSHQYDEHKQQTGLPPGALAQAIAFNHANAVGYGSGTAQFAMGGPLMDGGHSMKRERGSVDFSVAPVGNPLEMDMEMDSVAAVPTLMFTSSQNDQTQFIDPTALGGQEPVASGPSTQVGRMYPGMHQQQAAMARAAQQQQPQQHQQKQQQQQQNQNEFRRPQHVQQRRPENQAPQAGTPSHRPMQHPDPVVEERITRLLQQMRQNIVVSDEDGKSADHLPHVGRSRKDEQDMDDDERLLASEEGKKLTSKERRQLRNKVSARAFRSRRKEYIGQLESEIAAKANEAQELRLQNRALVEENTRLSDLARMLLASPHFSTFLDDLSINGLPAPTSQAQQPPLATSQPQHSARQLPSVTPQPPVQPDAPREADMSQAHAEFQMSQNPQTEMLMMPTQSTNVVPAALDSVGWNAGIDMNFGNPTVFAVLDVPEPSLFPADLLSGKSADLSNSPWSESKEEFNCLEHPAAFEESKTVGEMNPDVDIDESDPAFALFLDSPDASWTHNLHETMTDDDPFIYSTKADPAIELVVDGATSTNASAAAWYRLRSLCDSIEPAFQRISLLTSHLS